MPDKYIKDLRKMWLKEKDEYKTSEIGSGVQKFVKEIFKCSEIFNLKEGLLNTFENKRKNEFLEETKNKGRRADIVIFIDGDIVIPVEVEKFGNIQAGEKQLFQYQADWIKKYGILTDGNEWRFYNDRYYETFDILQILAETPKFLTFWKEYIQPESYYRSFFEKKGQQFLFELPVPHLDDVREDFFKDITRLIENFKNKLNLKGYFKKEKKEVDKEKKAVEITYAYLIQFFLYKVLVDNGFSNFEDDWEVRLTSIKKALKKGIYGDILNKIVAISNRISEKIYKRFSDEQSVINDRIKEILDKPKTDINDVSVWLDILLFINRYDFSNVQNEIFGYVYENYLKDLYLKEKKGQYFTDPHVVEFMLNELGYINSNIQKRYINNPDSISIIDPSCGSGTFLYNATHRIVEAFYKKDNKSAKLAEKIINENIFGLDIAEFPLYLAEMNILMRMLPIVINEKYNNPIEQKIKVFKTRDSIAEFLDTAIRNTQTDIDISSEKQGTQLNLFSETLDLGYDSFMRDKGDLDDLKKSLELKNKKPRTKFDFVIGNPPYVGYNECCSQILLSFDLMKPGGVLKLNDVYGMNLHSIPTNTKKHRPNPNLYCFFIALGLGLLKDNGKICYIIPQTMLTASDLDVIRYHLANFTTIEKIYVFSNKMFVGRGIKQSRPVPTSSLIFVIRKSKPVTNHEVKIFYYNNTEKDINECLKDIKNRNHTKTTLLAQSILASNPENWNFIKFDDDFIELFKDYKDSSNDLISYYNHELASDKFHSYFIFDGGYSIDESIRLDTRIADDSYIYPKFLSNSYSRIIPNGFWPNKRNPTNKHFIGLRQASQKYMLLDSTHKIVWSYANPKKFHFTSEPIIWARNQFNAIGSENKDELLYLFALLNSKLNMKIMIANLKSTNEKDLLFSITSIKSFIRTPDLKKENINIKNEIICSVNKMIELEKYTLDMFVDFKNVFIQKFDHIIVTGNKFIINYKGREVECQITQKQDLVKKIVTNMFGTELINEFGIGNISDLKSLPAYDIEYQYKLKDYIDDLVFSLYFSIEIPKIGYDNADKIKRICSKHKYYKLVNED